MGTDELHILEFLKTKTEFFSVREVSRRVGGRRRADKDPLWAKPCLIRLANAGHLIMNDRGHFHYKPPEERSKKPKDKLHLSPQIAAILAVGGRPVPGIPGMHDVSDN